MSMIIPVVSDVLYLVLSVMMAVWVARTLHRNGRIFLVDAFGGNGDLADSVNQLLVVGFYLINIGFVSIYLTDGGSAETLGELVRVVSRKVGVVMLVLGGMHFFNLYVFSRIRRRAVLRNAPPPIAPQATVPDSPASWTEIRTSAAGR